MSYEGDLHRENVDRGRARVAHLMPLLRGRRSLWHCTSLDGLRGIVTDGGIRPNDGSLRSSYRTTVEVGHAGYRFGGVCLFDFDTAPLDDVHWAAQHWHQFLTSYPVTAVLELSREALATDALIEQDGPNWMPPLYQPPGNASPHYPRWIPFVEAWHKGPISLDAVRRVFSFRACSGNKFEDIGPITTAITAIENLAGKWAAEYGEVRSREIADDAPNIGACLRWSGVDSAVVGFKMARLRGRSH